MIVGMLGILASVLLFSTANAVGASVLFVICPAAAVLFAAMIFLGWFEHVRPGVKNLKADNDSE